MLFNSLTFLLFLPTTFVAYWWLHRSQPRAQNLLLIFASYVFYGWWDYRFLSLIFVSSLVDYIVGAQLGKTQTARRRRVLLAASLLTNLGILGFFKYFNFFVDSAAEALEAIGFGVNLPALQVILPVGISFYTFQTLSYTIDIYRRQIEPVRDPLAFFAFVSFFPQLVAGPIERARNLLPQFTRVRRFDEGMAADGLRQALWGFFKKVVIADNLAPYVDVVFAGHASADPLTLAVGITFFAFQIYCDFSGYSDIAIGVARLFGFDLMRNFAFPYFSRDIGEFWRRWHISLSTWFRDYVFIPLGGSRAGTGRRIFNIVVTFTVSGLWHGANWTFVFWGLLNGLYYIPLMLRDRHRQHLDIAAQGKALPSIREAVMIGVTFLQVLVAWILFRSESLGAAWEFFIGLFTHGGTNPEGYGQFGWPFALIGILLVVEWVQREKQHGLAIETLPAVVRWSIYYAIVAGCLWAGNASEVPFIYFQF
jgi:alginate O-acetyltransferase complex protein AlgI